MNSDANAFQERQKTKEALMAANPCSKEEIQARNCLSKEANCDAILTKLYDCQGFWQEVKKFYQKKYRSALVLTVKNREAAKEEYLASLTSESSNSSSSSSS